MLRTNQTFKKIWLFVLLGLLIRLVLMPITLHSDVLAVSFSQYLFSFKGVINIYDYLNNLPSDSTLVLNYGRNFFTYPPLAYFTLGIFGMILKPFFNSDFITNLAGNLPNLLSDNRLYWHLFLTKLPYLFFDFGILFLLAKIFPDEKKKKIVMILWLFNPLAIYTSYMIGQFDIIPVFFTVLCLYLVKQKKLLLGAMALGLGGAFKMYPLFFLPFLASGESRSIKNFLKLFLAGGAIYFVSILPFLGSSAFRQTVLLSNQSQKMLFAKISVSGAEYLSIFLVLYLFLVSVSFCKKLDLWKWFLLILLLLFGVTHYHPQWFLWLTPFLAIFWVENKNSKLLPIILMATWFSIMLLFEPSLSIGLFSPINNRLATVIPLSEIINRFYNVFDLKSLIRSVAGGVSLGMAFLLFRDEKTI